jgi:predicted TIM-barrel fold metal-dependent hydrolase
MLTRREALFGAAAAGVAGLFRGISVVSADGPQPSMPVKWAVPPGACDTHVHVFGDQRQYPYAPTSGYRHPPATADELNALHKHLHVDRVVVVQPSGYGVDNRSTLDGVGKLGSRARAVVAIDDKTTDKELDDFDRRGARGIRVNIGQTMPEARQRLEASTRRIAGRKWHLNTAVNLSLLEGLFDSLAGSPVPIVIDHWVGAQPALGPGQAGMETLGRLMKTGKVYIKITHRIHTLSKQPPDYPDAAPIAKAIVAANPERILFGTDWPHAGIRPPDKTPTDISPYVQIDDGRLFNQFPVWVPDAAQRKTILVDNPARLYGF